MATFSSLCDKIDESTTHSGQRTHTIDRITPHCWVGQVTLENGLFNMKYRKDASCNYIIGRDGRIGGCVREEYRSWCSSSRANDQRAITIECASDNKAPYTFNDEVYKSLVQLCWDICKRYNKNSLIWISDKNKSLAYEPKSNEMILTVHRWFANKSCPGDWLMSRMPQLAEEVTGLLRVSGSTPSPVQNNKEGDTIMVSTKTVKNGSRNNTVKSLQILLKGLGFKGSNGKVLTLDGICGTNTVYAIKNYQSSKKLAVDGICGAKTWESLLN